MGQPYFLIYSSTAPVGGFTRGGSIAIAAASFRVIAVPFADRAKITGVTVVQTGGVAVAFTLAVLNSSKPYVAGEYPNGSPAGSPVDLYRVIEEQSAIAGSSILYRTEYGQEFCNADGNPTISQRYLYLLLAPTAALGATTWDISITGQTLDP